MELPRQGLGPFVEREFRNLHKAKAGAEALGYAGNLPAPSDARQAGDRTLAKKPLAKWDVAALLKLMWKGWNDVFDS